MLEHTRVRCGILEIPRSGTQPRLLAIHVAVQVHALLNEYLSRFRVTQVYTLEEVEHWSVLALGVARVGVRQND